MDREIVRGQNEPYQALVWSWRLGWKGGTETPRVVLPALRFPPMYNHAIYIYVYMHISPSELQFRLEHEAGLGDGC